MVKSTKAHFELEDGEYIITSEHPMSRKIEVFYEGEEITKTVTAIVRNKI